MALAATLKSSVHSTANASSYATGTSGVAATYPDGYDSAAFVDNLRWTSAGCSTANGTVTLDKVVDNTLGGTATKTSWTTSWANRSAPVTW